MGHVCVLVSVVSVRALSWWGCGCRSFWFIGFVVWVIHVLKAGMCRGRSDVCTTWVIVGVAVFAV